MRTWDLIKWRFTVGKNMIVQSRRGLAYGRDALPQGSIPTKHRTELTELEEYVEAHEIGRGIWKWQHYLPIYERHFSKFRSREVHVVEIGVHSGGSLEMWKEYFGPGCHIYGVDIEPACQIYESPEVDIFIGDQADPSFWKDFVKKVPHVDIVIDDGGHRIFQQVATLEALLPHIRPGGVYLCEDLGEEYNPFFDYLFGLSRALQTYRPPGTKITNGWPPTGAQQAIDSIHLYPFVCVVEKRSDRLERLWAPRRGTEWQPRGWKVSR
jgi:23S rRNA U2552 (ribose-2'-O)-methylase RlmE/FtsJ